MVPYDKRDMHAVCMQGLLTPALESQQLTSEPLGLLAYRALSRAFQASTCMHALSGSCFEIGITPKSQEAANQMVEIIFWCPRCDDIPEVVYCNLGVHVAQNGTSYVALSSERKPVAFWAPRTMIRRSKETRWLAKRYAETPRGIMHCREGK
jgi:hypothetical protein